MKHHSNLKILAFVGLSGSGKSTAVELFTEAGYPKVYFGGIVLNAMKEHGLEITPANENSFREKLRQDEGKDFVVKRIIEQIKDLEAAGQHRIVADGLYTWTEYKAMHTEFGPALKTIAIVAPKHLRYDRLGKRDVRPLTIQEAHDRDWAEIENLEKGGPIAIADQFVLNNGDVAAFHAQLETIKAELGF